MSPSGPTFAHDNSRRKDNLTQILSKSKTKSSIKGKTIPLVIHKEAINLKYEYCSKFNIYHQDSIVFVKKENTKFDTTYFEFYKIKESGDILDTMLIEPK